MSDGWWNTVLRVVTASWGLKALAVVAAALTYYAIRTETGHEVEYEVPVIVKMEPGVAIREQNPMAVRVRFRGSQEDLLRLDHRKLQVWVNPTDEDRKNLEVSVPVKPGDVRGAEHVQTLRVEPPAVSLSFDREIGTTAVVAKPKTVGTPLVGKAEVEFEPQTVHLRGPKRRLDELKKDGQIVVQTEPVDVDGRVKSFTRQLRVVPPGDTWVSQIEPSTVTAKVSIVTKSAAREWSDVPVMALVGGGAQRVIVFDPPTVRVTVEGPSEDLDRLAQNAVTVFVDCEALDQSGSYQLPVEVHLDDALSLRTIVDPPSVKVAFEARQP
jgi:YbbR domain-containing protein